MAMIINSCVHMYMMVISLRNNHALQWIVGRTIMYVSVKKACLPDTCTPFLIRHSVVLEHQKFWIHFRLQGVKRLYGCTVIRMYE